MVTTVPLYIFICKSGSLPAIPLQLLQIVFTSKQLIFLYDDSFSLNDECEILNLVKIFKCTRIANFH